MTTEEIIEGNTLVHDWMGEKRMKPPFENWWLGAEKPEDLDYHRVWGSLMSVIERIEGLPRDEFHGKFIVYISSNTCTIQGSKLNTTPEYYRPAYFADYVLATKIESVWYACVRFVKWYSENKNNKNELV